MKNLERDSIDFGKSKIGPLFRSIFFSTLLSMVFTSLLTVVDGIFVGQGVGSDALAAVNIVAPLFLVTTGIALMLLALQYLIPLLPGCVFILIETIGTFVIRLDGSPRFASAVSIVPGILNIFLDWLFVFPMKMGIAGSSVATTVCCAIASAMVAWYMLRRSQSVHLYMLKLSRTSLYLTVRNIGYMSRSGFSSMLGELAMSMIMLTGNYVFIRWMGEDGVAAFSVACYLYPIVFMVNNSVAQSAQPIISFNYGAGKEDRVREAFRLSLRTAAICGLLATAVLTLGATPLISLFLQAGTKPYEIATAGLPLFAVSSVFFALNIAIIGYYQSIELNGQATLYMLLRGLVFLVPAFILMPQLIFPQGMWLAVPVSECLTLGVILLTKK